MNNLMIIGQYVPSNSIIHRLDPRTKMVIIFLFIFSVFLANNLWSYVTLVAFAFLSIGLSRVPTRFIVKGLTPVWFLIAFTFILHLIVTKEGTVLFEWKFIEIYSGALVQVVKISMRFFLLILVTSLLTLTTTPIEITDAIEYLLAPLKKVRFPVHELALMMSISLRFIPTLMQETDKISKAQATRGVDFKTGKLTDRVKAIVPLLVPLFVSAFKRAEELAMAMEARGYRGDEGRSKLRALQVSMRDYVAYTIFIIMVVLLFVTRSYT